MLQSQLCHLLCLTILGQAGIPQEKQQIVRGWKFGSLSETAPLPVKALDKQRYAFLDKRAAGRTGPHCFLLTQMLGQHISHRNQLPAIFPPAPVCLFQQRHQLRFRKIRARPKRLLFRCQENRERPAAGAVHGNARRHINRIHIGTLFPVNFDWNKGAVEHCRNFLRFERFMRHDMAPVAGRITDAQKNGLVLPFGFFQRRSPPRTPVHRIFRMLKQIR